MPRNSASTWLDSALHHFPYHVITKIFVRGSSLFECYAQEKVGHMSNHEVSECERELDLKMSVGLGKKKHCEKHVFFVYSPFMHVKHAQTIRHQCH